MITLNPQIKDLLEKIKNIYKSETGHTVTVGVGEQPIQAHKSLVYGKNTGKDKVVVYDDEVEKESAEIKKKQKELEVQFKKLKYRANLRVTALQPYSRVFLKSDPSLHGTFIEVQDKKPGDIDLVIVWDKPQVSGHRLIETVPTDVKALDEEATEEQIADAKSQAEKFHSDLAQYESEFDDKVKDAVGEHVYHRDQQACWVDPSGEEFSVTGEHSKWIDDNAAMLKDTYGLEFNPDSQNPLYTLLNNGWTRTYFSADQILFHVATLNSLPSGLDNFIVRHPARTVTVENLWSSKYLGVDYDDVIEHGLQKEVTKALTQPVLASDRSPEFGKAYWVSPDGQIYPVEFTHGEWINSHRDLLVDEFGFTNEQLTNADRVMYELLDSGWVRVMAGPHEMEINVGSLMDVPATIDDIVAQIWNPSWSVNVNDSNDSVSIPRPEKSIKPQIERQMRRMVNAKGEAPMEHIRFDPETHYYEAKDERGNPVRLGDFETASWDFPMDQLEKARINPGEWVAAVSEAVTAEKTDDEEWEAVGRFDSEIEASSFVSKLEQDHYYQLEGEKYVAYVKASLKDQWRTTVRANRKVTGQQYTSIVFLQGDDATEPLQILDEKGEDAVMEYLKQWDYGDGYGEITNSPGYGTSDRHVEKDGYVLVWNSSIGYIGLEKIFDDSKIATDITYTEWCDAHGINPSTTPDEAWSLADQRAMKNPQYKALYDRREKTGWSTGVVDTPWFTNLNHQILEMWKPYFEEAVRDLTGDKKESAMAENKVAAQVPESVLNEINTEIKNSFYRMNAPGSVAYRFSLDDDKIYRGEFIGDMEWKSSDFGPYQFMYHFETGELKENSKYQSSAFASKATKTVIKGRFNLTANLFELSIGKGDLKEYLDPVAVTQALSKVASFVDASAFLDEMKGNVDRFMERVVVKEAAVDYSKCEDGSGTGHAGPIVEWYHGSNKPSHYCDKHLPSEVKYNQPKDVKEAGAGLEAGTKVTVKPTAPGLVESYPAAKWLTEEMEVTLKDYAPNGNTLDVIDVILPDGREESIYDFNIIKPEANFDDVASNVEDNTTEHDRDMANANYPGRPTDPMNLDADKEDEEKLWWSSSSGRIELQMTLEQAKSVSHQGDCESDARELVKELKPQLDKIDPKVLASELKVYGAWDEKELSDHEMSLVRLVWIAGSDIVEENYLKGNTDNKTAQDDMGATCPTCGKAACTCGSVATEKTCSLCKVAPAISGSSFCAGCKEMEQFELSKGGAETEKGYQGWTNYSTWGLSLHLDNEEGIYNESREMASNARDAAELAAELKERYSNLLEEKGENDKHSDEVNWREIAEDLIDEVKENKDYDRSQGAGGVIDKLPTIDIEKSKSDLIDQLNAETDPEKKKSLERRYKHLTMAMKRKSEEVDPEAVGEEFAEPDWDGGDIGWDDSHRGPTTAWQNGKQVAVLKDGDWDKFYDDIRAHMEKTQYWPNVWHVSDHGNAHLVKDIYKKSSMDKGAVAPPGMEHVVKKLKKENPEVNPFAVSWSIYNKKHPKKSELEPELISTGWLVKEAGLSDQIRSLKNQLKSATRPDKISAIVDALERLEARYEKQKEHRQKLKDERAEKAEEAEEESAEESIEDKAALETKSSIVCSICGHKPYDHYIDGCNVVIDKRTGKICSCEATFEDDEEVEGSLETEAGTHSKCIKCDKTLPVSEMVGNVHGAGYLCQEDAKEWNKDTEASLETEAATNDQVIQMFVNDSFPKDKRPTWGTDNLKIVKEQNGWSLLNYGTPLMFRGISGETFINTQKYSVTTSRVQNQIKQLMGGFGTEVDEAGIRSAMDNAGAEPEDKEALWKPAENEVKADGERLSDPGAASVLDAWNKAWDKDTICVKCKDGIFEAQDVESAKRLQKLIGHNMFPEEDYDKVLATVSAAGFCIEDQTEYISSEGTTPEKPTDTLESNEEYVLSEDGLSWIKKLKQNV